MSYDLKKLIDLIRAAASLAPEDVTDASITIARPEPSVTNVIVSLTVKEPATPS